MNNIIVAKFGGTSLKDASAITRSVKIALDTQAKVVVVSATAGTTNTFKHLIELANLSPMQALSQLQIGLFDELKEKHLQIAKELNVDLRLLGKIEFLITEAKATYQKLLLCNQTNNASLQDELYSYGERLSSLIFTEAIVTQGMTGICEDARNFLKTNSNFLNARPLLDETRKMAEFFLSAHLQNLNTVVVTQGFIGSNEHGQTTTLGRGGSDFSAALIAEAIGADSLYIWTDVKGIFTTDPRIVSDAEQITELSYQEAAELANFGAKVLHPACLAPVIRAKIPLFVGSSINPENGGTWVLENPKEVPFMRALAKRDNQKLLTLSSVNMVGTPGFLAQIFNILAKFELSVDLVTTSEASVALTLDGNNNGCGGEVSLNPELLNELSQFCHVEVEDGLSLIALIGNNMHFTPGLSTKAFAPLDNYNVRMVCHGASTHNFCFLLSSSQASEVIKILHERFIGITPVEALV